MTIHHGRNLERKQTGNTGDDGMDLACAIGKDLFPDLGAALDSAWMKETIANLKAAAWDEGYAYLFDSEINDLSVSLEDNPYRHTETPDAKD